MFAHDACMPHGPFSRMSRSRRRWGGWGPPHPPHPPHPHHGPPPWLFEMFGGRRRRAERGEVRYLILDALKEQPSHGYEIIQTIAEKTGGTYKPSPGTVYPTLQLLEEMGHVTSKKKAGKKIYEITDEGLAELAEHQDEVDEAYDRLGPDLDGDEWEQFLGLFERIPRLMRAVGRAFRRGKLAPAQMSAIKDVMDDCADRIEAIAKGTVEVDEEPTSDE